MLLPAALRVADRLITALMTLLRAVAPTPAASTSPALPEAAAYALFFRLGRLVTYLIRISNFGVRTPRTHTSARVAKPPPPPAAPRVPRRPALRLPSRPGWLLAALPSIAPTIADDLRALLANPAIATLSSQPPPI